MHAPFSVVYDRLYVPNCFSGDGGQGKPGSHRSYITVRVFRENYVSHKPTLTYHECFELKHDSGYWVMPPSGRPAGPRKELCFLCSGYHRYL